MKNKEIKNLAKKIAQQEKIIQNPDSTTEQKQRAESEIIKLSSCVENIEDMIKLDEAIQELMEKI